MFSTGAKLGGIHKKGRLGCNCGNWYRWILQGPFPARRITHHDARFGFPPRKSQKHGRRLFAPVFSPAAEPPLDFWTRPRPSPSPCSLSTTVFSIFPPFTSPCTHFCIRPLPDIALHCIDSRFSPDSLFVLCFGPVCASRATLDPLDR